MRSLSEKQVGPVKEIGPHQSEGQALLVRTLILVPTIGTPKIIQNGGRPGGGGARKTYESSKKKKSRSSPAIKVGCRTQSGGVEGTRG